MHGIDEFVDWTLICLSVGFLFGWVGNNVFKHIIILLKKK